MATGAPAAELDEAERTRLTELSDVLGRDRGRVTPGAVERETCQGWAVHYQAGSRRRRRLVRSQSRAQARRRKKNPGLTVRDGKDVLEFSVRFGQPRASAIESCGATPGRHGDVLRR